MSVTNIYSFLRGLLKQDWKKNKKRIADSRLSKESIKALKEANNQILFSIYNKLGEPMKFWKTNDSNRTDNKTDNLDQAIVVLDNVFNSLKEQIVTVVDASITVKSKQLIETHLKNFP